MVDARSRQEKESRSIASCKAFKPTNMMALQAISTVGVEPTMGSTNGTVGSAAQRDVAISIRSAHMVYQGAWSLGTLKKPIPHTVLKGLNMTVATGTIYGLLGASGCGKTTIMKAIAGQVRFTSGEVLVFGSEPGSPGSDVPGPAIGYMPQELGLYGEFSIPETMWYFGRIAGMPKKHIDERTESLIKLLDLPTHDGRVGNLSGGQQRRVSFAVALLHRPALLILDEPTVGVDPVLRHSIWEHLMDLTRDKSTTVIITTHYIEEARRADAIGLMRNGVLLAQAPPEQLMIRFRCESLEDVLLLLSRRQENSQPLVGSEGDGLMVAASGFDAIPQSDEQLFHVGPSTPNITTERSMWNRFHALLWRNTKWLQRNLWVVGIVVMLAFVESIAFCLCVGRDPEGLHFAIFNQESNCSQIFQMNDLRLPHTSKLSQVCMNNTEISCVYLSRLKEKGLELDFHNSMEAAYEAVRRGFAWGIIHVDANFSSAMYERVHKGSDILEEIVDQSILNITMDWSNQLIGTMLNNKLSETMLDFIQDVFENCRYDRRAGSIPINFETPIYGDLNPQYIDFASPGMIASLVFVLAGNAAMCSLLPEKRNAIMDRSLSLGVTMMEVLYAQYFVQIVLMVIQMVITIGVIFGFFNLTNHGNVWEQSLLMFIMGLGALWFGFLTALHAPTDMAANLGGMFMCFVFMFMASTLWPWEGMFYLMQYCSYFLPMTYPVDAMRVMINRGWGIEYPAVQHGFEAAIAWLVIFYVLTLVSVRKRKSGL